MLIASFVSVHFIFLKKNNGKTKIDAPKRACRPENKALQLLTFDARMANTRVPIPENMFVSYPAFPWDPNTPLHPDSGTWPVENKTLIWRYFNGFPCFRVCDPRVPPPLTHPLLAARVLNNLILNISDSV